MHNHIRNDLTTRIECKMRLLPWYVQEFLEGNRYKKSPNTLLNYVYDYISFFDWLIAKCFYHGARENIPVEVLEKLNTLDIESYTTTLSNEKGNTKNSIARKVAALKSLFGFLSHSLEDESGFPCLKRNVMVKVHSEPNYVSAEKRASLIEDYILLNEDIAEFRLFITEKYGDLCSSNKRIFNAYQKNKERDLAIISLVLGSGLRISEALSLDLVDVDLNSASVSIVRKGKKEAVIISRVAQHDLKSYLDTRQSRYFVNGEIQAVFLSQPTGPHGMVGRLTIRAAQKMLERYVELFGMPELNHQKLRQSFATMFHQENNNLEKLQEQLGQSDLNVTRVYNHVATTNRKTGKI
ncbi:site-specific recombinase XerD [Paenibacillus taihuensis]|uniref:Site-specific recombinase XerD n=1 Tax=Paenibacillus taihuensis TaxID=1156355 RepID=A0A3D9R074_9BACL|nr:tyrosine recombinase XerS [Paenibacillus taihuensis]REE67019.1 site-specific recombinase XerD [Paenibacillus taihuensis]